MAAGVLPNLAADKPATAPKAETSFLSGVSISPIGVVAYKDVTDSPEYGAGLSVGYQLNKYVSLNADLIAFEDGNWGGSAIDETDLVAKFKLFSAKKLSLYGVAGGGREWNRDDWAVIVGGGTKFSFTKAISVFGEYRFQVWVDEGADSQIQAGLQITL